MNKFKKVLTSGISLMMCAATITACAGTVNPGKKDSESDVDPSTINVNIDPQTEAEIEIMVPGGNINERTMIDCLIEDFAMYYPNVTIIMSYISVDNYVSSVRNMNLGHTLPDILWSNSPDFYDALDLGAIANLTPYIQASEGKVLNAYRSEEDEPMTFHYEDDFYTEYFGMGTKDSKNYVVPRSCDSVITFFNKDILEKAGVDLNPETTLVKNGWTWDEFLTVCAQVRTWMDANGHSNDYVVDANLTSWLSVCYPLLASFGSEVISTNGENAIDCEETKTCVEMVREMVEKRYINDSQVATSTSFETGNSAMLFQSASVSLFANKVSLKGKIDLVSFPLVMDANNPKIGAGIAGYTITNSCKNKEVAWAFLTYLLSQKGQQNMALHGLNLASIRKDLSDYTTANWGKNYSTLNLSAYTFGSQYKISTDFFVRTKLTAKAGIQQALTQMFIGATNREKDIASVIKTAKRDIDDALIDY